MNLMGLTTDIRTHIESMRKDKTILTFTGEVRLIRRSGEIEIEWGFYPVKRDKITDRDDGI